MTRLPAAGKIASAMVAIRFRPALAGILWLAACGKRGPLEAPRRAVPEMPALSATRIGAELRLSAIQSGQRENGKPVPPPEAAQFLFTGGALRSLVERPAAHRRAEWSGPLPAGSGEIEVSARWKDGRGRLSNATAAIRFPLAPVAEAVTAFTATAEPDGLRLRFAGDGPGVVALRLAEKTPAGEVALAEFPPAATDHLLAPVRDGEPRELVLRALYRAAPPVLSAGKSLTAVWADTFPPAPPASLQAFAGEEGVELYWPPPEDPDAADAVLERAVGSGEFGPLATVAAGEGRHLDAAPPEGIPLAYRLRFADRAKRPNLSDAKSASARWNRPAPGGPP